MATWEEVRGHLRARWRVERDDPTAFAVSCRVPIGTQDLHQAVGMAPTEVDSKPWLSIIGELFPEAALSARGALTYADRLPLGAIVLRGDRYLLRHGIALAPLALAELDWILAIIVREAALLRANLRGPSALASGVFGNYAE
jgi:hypothetical protein